jgi:hypothetical protein
LGFELRRNRFPANSPLITNWPKPLQTEARSPDYVGDLGGDYQGR